MANSNESQTNLVADVLAKHWSIHEPATRTHLGVSRATWRVGPFFWLSQAEHVRLAELSRQSALLYDLHRYLLNERFSISIPEIVPNHNGNLVVSDRGYVWSLTRNLPGFHPDARDLNTYPVLMEGLSQFHRLLGGFLKHLPAQLHDGICVRTRQNIDRVAKESLVGFTADPHERTLLEQAAEWLLPRLSRFELLPRQIIHGDWTPRNVLFDHTGRAMHLTAVLDLEAMAWDPVCVDVANTCSTLLMWSGLVRPEEQMRRVVDVYEQSTGVRLEWLEIHTAMLAHWFCHYWYWRDRLQAGEFGREVKERLCFRISSVLSYIMNGREGSP